MELDPCGFSLCFRSHTWCALLPLLAEKGFLQQLSPLLFVYTLFSFKNFTNSGNAHVAAFRKHFSTFLNLQTLLHVFVSINS